MLKIDLSKAFDRVSWLFLRMILTHLGFPQVFIKWIMCCITFVSFGTLINGSVSCSFQAERGIRQGCPLSPLIFLIVMEGLSRLIALEKRARRLKGLKIMEQCTLTHQLFVDDMLIFLDGGIQDDNTLSKVLNLFCAAIGMEINGAKSTISLSACTQQETYHALQNFPFQNLTMEDGLKYLGFRIKADGYKIAYWTWLIAKVERRLNIWSHHLLSRAGRLVVIKSVLEPTPVFWMALSWIPQGILQRIE